MDKDTSTSKGKTLLEFMRDNKYDGYGSVVPAETMRLAAGIFYPKKATKKVFDAIALQELGAIDYVRNILINEGKYLAKSHDNYRIFLPSENAGAVAAYMDAADNKMKRAHRLAKNTPSTETFIPSNLTTRLMMKQESLIEDRERAAMRK